MTRSGSARLSCSTLLLLLLLTPFFWNRWNSSLRAWPEALHLHLLHWLTPNSLVKKTCRCHAVGNYYWIDPSGHGEPYKECPSSGPRTCLMQVLAWPQLQELSHISGQGMNLDVQDMQGLPNTMDARHFARMASSVNTASLALSEDKIFGTHLALT